MNIGDKIRAAREDMDLSQSQVASLIPMNQSNYSKIERNLQEPNLAQLKSICKIYNHEKVILVFNGDTLVPSVNLAISFPGEILPEEDVYEGKMMMETTALWPDKGYLFEKPSNLLFDLDVVSSPEQVTFTGTNNERYYKVDGRIRIYVT